ncbi:hypothetical protein P43SY_001237 [Pythium insidiosum]|uniref:RecF/RecN/SMC N-terminal domain-containing protein n=1 Tax=Pythium insidiosum TaxID=114742 RepID=A0AAD5LVX0_PYTIN|nr:hypothetical protein P43SY_001237 [Pythium insidiosum]
MHIEEIILDGFKSYATRTVISGFDPRFNAITGLNGSGKSNVLDAICFVLGITNLSQVRANNLQELVYKQGQAGVTKASVTIVFNNKDTKSSPVGYEQYEEISVARQVVIGGRNKYLINGHTAQVSQVQNLFHSVQLNVNNPHFLIMQGRITKVLNMKPPEILGMIEEAAGTRMYENKKQAALKTMMKKEKKVEEINKILADEITPTLEKLRSEKTHYLQWSANNTEMERLQRFCIAYEFQKAQDALKNTAHNVEKMQNQLKAAEQQEAEINEEVELVEDQKAMLHKKREKEMGKEFQSLKDNVERIGKELVKFTTKMSHSKSSIEQHQKALKSLEEQHIEADSNVIKLKRDVEKADGDLQHIQSSYQSKENESNEYQRQIQALNAAVKEAEKMELKVNEVQGAYDEASQKLEERRSQLTQCDDQLKKLADHQMSLMKKKSALELERKKNEHKISRLVKDEQEAKVLVKKLEKTNPWIESERQFFGREHTDYDFRRRDPATANHRLLELKEAQNALAKKINKKVMGMIEKAEQEYQGLMNKRHIIENDKEKITTVIKELDAKKNEALETTWVKAPFLTVSKFE